MSFHVTPDNVPLTVGQAPSQLTAKTVHSDDGASADVTHQVTWASANAQIATVSSSGRVQAVKLGATTITAAKGQVTSNRVTVTVTDKVSQEGAEKGERSPDRSGLPGVWGPMAKPSRLAKNSELSTKSQGMVVLPRKDPTPC